MATGKNDHSSAAAKAGHKSRKEVVASSEVELPASQSSDLDSLTSEDPDPLISDCLGAEGATEECSSSDEAETYAPLATEVESWIGEEDCSTTDGDNLQTSNHPRRKSRMRKSSELGRQDLQSIPGGPAVKRIKSGRLDAKINSIVGCDGLLRNATPSDCNEFEGESMRRDFASPPRPDISRTKRRASISHPAKPKRGRAASSSEEPRMGNEQLKLTGGLLECAVWKARIYWIYLAREARKQRANGITAAQLDLRAMLLRTPAIPKEHLDLSNGVSLPVTSTWRVNGETPCGIHNSRSVLSARMRIGIKQPSRLDMDGKCFHHWAEEERLQTNGPNYVGILTLAWAYILSARLIEMQGREGASMSYTGSEALPYQYERSDMQPRPMICIDIGEADGRTAMWWRAILAPEQGWKAIILQRARKVYQAPWAVLNTANLAIGRRTSRVNIDEVLLYLPPTSEEALVYLAHFCALHNLEGQLRAALAAALTLPTLNALGVHPRLPRLQVHKVEMDTNPLRIDEATTAVNNIAELLPYCMALSCNTSVVHSSLCAIFWDPLVPCNFVSPWLHTIMSEIRHGLRERSGYYHELLSYICLTRRPGLSALWLGAALTGLTVHIINRVDSGSSRLDINGYPWTGCPQSFLDDTGSGPYFVADAESTKIARADVWRLLFLPGSVREELSSDGAEPATTSDKSSTIDKRRPGKRKFAAGKSPVFRTNVIYRPRPSGPWQPPGATYASAHDHRVRAHLQCSRHAALYQHWNWKLKNGTVLQDAGFVRAVGEGEEFSQTAYTIGEPRVFGIPVYPLSKPYSTSPEWNEETAASIADLCLPEKLHMKGLPAFRPLKSQRSSKVATQAIFQRVLESGEYMDEEICRDKWIEDLATSSGKHTIYTEDSPDIETGETTDSGDSARKIEALSPERLRLPLEPWRSNISVDL